MSFDLLVLGHEKIPGFLENSRLDYFYTGTLPDTFTGHPRIQRDALS
jgi:hypothetical protein